MGVLRQENTGFCFITGVSRCQLMVNNLKVTGDVIFFLKIFFFYSAHLTCVLSVQRDNPSTCSERWQRPGRVQPDAGERLSAQGRQAAQSHETGQALNFRDVCSSLCHEKVCFCRVHLPRRWTKQLNHSLRRWRVVAGCLAAARPSAKVITQHSFYPHPTGESPPAVSHVTSPESHTDDVDEHERVHW